jgi:hypothetical protein
MNSGAKEAIAGSKKMTVGIAGVLRRAFSFPVFLGTALAVGAFVTTSWDGVPAGKVFKSGDTWWLLAAGEHILSTHNWPTKDPYSFTVAGSPWVVYEWLGGVLMALAMRLGDLCGLAALLVLLCVAFILLLYYYAWLCSRSSKAAAVACASILPIFGPLLSLRAQLLGYIFLVATLICLERFRQGHPRSIWILPGLFMLWVNTHSSFVFGLVAVGVYWACGLFRFRFGKVLAEPLPASERLRLLVVFLLSVLALAVTPYGPRLANYPLEFTLLQSIFRTVGELRPLELRTSYGVTFLVLLLVLSALQIRTRVTHRLEGVTLLAFAAVESCVHARVLFFFIPVFAPMLAKVLAPCLPPYEPGKDHYVANAALIAGMILGIAVFSPGRARLNEVLSQEYPVGAANYVLQGDNLARMYNDDAWGSYLVWRLGPRHKVFIDGRLDIYDYAGVFEDFRVINDVLPGTDLLLRKYRIGSFLLHRKSPLDGYLASKPDWERVYEDKISTIFVRKQNDARQGPGD